MDFGILAVLVGVIVIFLAWYYHKTSIYNHWKILGVPGPTAIPVLGNFPSTILCRTSFTEDLQRAYNEWKAHPFFGVYNGQTPYLVINDLDLVKTVLIKEYDTFPGRGFNIPDDNDSLSANIFSLEGHRWQILRSRLSPIFTTGKLKHMVDLMAECAEHFVKYLREEVKRSKVVEVREAASRFTTDVIGSCAFGINMNALSKEESEFREIGRKIFEPSKIQLIRKILREISPNLADLLTRFFIPKQTTEFFVNCITETIKYREKEKVFRNDLVDLLIDIKNKKDEIDIKVTDNLLAAQAFVFFASGFETSSTTISFILRELALVPAFQETLRNEILETLKKHEGQLSYAVINEMRFLDMVVQESLRKNPPPNTIRRTSVKPWTIPGTDITLPEKTNIIVPVYAFHHDPDYFENPEVFDPSRFDGGKRSGSSYIRPMSYLPFGSGPKNCIAERFAIYEIKLGVISVIQHFFVQPSESTKATYEIDKAALVLTIKGGVPLKFKAFNQNV